MREEKEEKERIDTSRVRETHERGDVCMSEQNKRNRERREEKKEEITDR